MLRQHTWTPLTEVASADLNSIQDKASGVLSGNAGNDFASATDVIGSDTRVWQNSASLADATTVKIDGSINYLDRIITGTCRRITANDRVGQSTDTNLNLTTAAVSTVSFIGYTGTGGYSSTAAATAVSNGVPPVNGVGAVRSYAIVADDTTLAGNVWLYVAPADNALYLYNQTGAAIYVLLTITVTGDCGKR